MCHSHARLLFVVRKLIRIMLRSLIWSFLLPIFLVSQTHGLKHCFTLKSPPLKHDQYLKTMNDSVECPFDQRDNKLYAVVELQSDCSRWSDTMKVTAKVNLDRMRTKATNYYEFNVTIEFQEYFSSNFRTRAGGKFVVKKITKLTVTSTDEREFLRNFENLDFTESKSTLIMKANAPCALNARLGTKLDLRKTPVKVDIILDFLEAPGTETLPTTINSGLSSDKTVYVLFPRKDLVEEIEEEDGVCESFVDSGTGSVNSQRLMIASLCSFAVAVISFAF